MASIAGSAVALGLAASERSERVPAVAALRDRLERRIVAEIPDVRVNGAGSPAQQFERLDCRRHVRGSSPGLDLDGVAVSAGSACASGVLEPSHVIAALGLEERWLRGVIRFSLGYRTREDEIDRAASALCRTVLGLRGNLAPSS